MAGQNRNAPDIVEKRLSEKPYSFGFFRALRLAECINPDKPKIGSSKKFSDDPIRLGQQPSLSFEHATLTSYHPATASAPAKLISRFFGLLGPNGPLPLHLTEFIRDRQRHHNDETLTHFMDIFHHRMLCLFYRAWADAQPTVSYDRPECNHFGDYLGSLSGIGMESLKKRDCINDSAKLHFAGRFACLSRNAEGLWAIVSRYFNVKTEIRQFVGEWIEIPKNGIWRLGDQVNSGQLGLSATVGNRVWSRQHKFRLILGPLKLEAYKGFLPVQRHLQHLIALVRNYIGFEYSWDLNLILDKDEVPPLRLNGENALGWTTWIGGGSKNEHADDLILNPLNLAKA